MKLKSITIGNIKNVAETKLNLGTIVAVVSTNNYGKSNILEAIQFGFSFIGASARDRSNMMRWTRGIPLTPGLAGKDFVFAVEFDAPELGIYRYVRYSFSFAWFNDQTKMAYIKDENIEARENEHVRYTSYLKRDKGQYKAGKTKTGFRKLSLSDDILALDILPSLEDIDIAEVVDKIKALSYRMCKTLELDNSYKLNPIKFDFDTPSSILFDDEDIPRALSILKEEHPDKYDLFAEMIYDLFPEFESIDLRTYTLKGQTVISSTEDKEDKKRVIPYHIKDDLHSLIIRSKYLNQPISMEYMSTGTKRIIWLIANAVFGNCYGVNLIAVDEIETSIHPKMMRSLLESIAYVLEDTSMIVSSHSPYLIQYLKPECIYIGVPDDSGVASFKRINPSKVPALLKTSRDLGMSVGEYIFELLAGDDDSASILSAYLEG